MIVKYGLFTWCDYDEGPPEPEGTTIWDHLPMLGDRKILSDKREYVVTQIDGDNMEIRMTPIIHAPEKLPH